MSDGQDVNRPDAPNKQAVGLDPPWVEGTGGAGSRSSGRKRGRPRKSEQQQPQEQPTESQPQEGAPSE